MYGGEYGNGVYYNKEEPNNFKQHNFNNMYIFVFNVYKNIMYIYISISISNLYPTWS